MQKRIGQILDLEEGIIVQQVNAQGVMASGFAKAVREKWPNVYAEYKAAFPASLRMSENEERHLLGSVIYVPVSDRLVVANLIGQQFYGRDSVRYTSYDALDLGFKEIADFARKTELEVHFPRIGAGLGGGDWTIISAIISVNLAKIKHTYWELPTAPK